MKFFQSITVLLLSGIIALGFSCQAPHSHDHDEDHDHDHGQEQESVTTDSLASTGSFGQLITKENAVGVSEIVSSMTSETETSVKVYGTILEVCQHTGCWLTFSLESGEELMVNMKDHDFYVPKDAAGKTAWVEGLATRELISVDMLKHYAEDAGKSQEEIDAITEDAWKYTIEAEGVIIE